MTISDSLSLSRELTAREIFNRIVKGQVVRIPNDPGLAKQLYNHLNVIKSREKRIFADLGLDFISSVISVTHFKKAGDWIKSESNPEINIQLFDEWYEVKLIAPKKRRKYTTFIIQPDEPSPSTI